MQLHISLCEIGWKLYDLGESHWKEYLKHRENCSECSKPSDVAYKVKICKNTKKNYTKSDS